MTVATVNTDAVPTDVPTRRRRVAIIVNTLTPYRVQAHLRFKHEIPNIEIDTYVTWDTSRNPWIYKDMPDIGVVTFPDAVAESMFGTVDYFIGDYRTGGRIIERMERSRPDAAVICGYAYPAMLRCHLWCRRRGIPVLLWSDSNVHADTAGGLRRVVKDVAVKRVARISDALLICGTNGERYWARYGARAERMFRVPVEPDYELIDRTPRAIIDEIAAKNRWDPGRRRMLICARLVPVKAVDQAIDAFSAIARKRPEFDLVIVGTGPLRRELEARVPTTLASRVTFAGFYDRQEAVNAFYRSCDVFVHPANWEPWGVVLLEAAAAGLAIITTSVVGAVPEVAHDGLNARIVPPNDRRALMEAMLSVTEPGRLESMKAASVQVSRHAREASDPVRGLRDALKSTGVL
ncbi:Putative glycosyltransferase EpsF [Phycisphaerales bacterium]|nr:Putative glycosyltransferase EpsF [Phycisphaerales bacterium]